MAANRDADRNPTGAESAMTVRVVIATHPRRGERARRLGPGTHALLEHADAPVRLVPTGAHRGDA